MSYRMLYFKCAEHDEFEDLADASTISVPCVECGEPAARVNKIEAPSLQTSGDPLTDKERKQAIAQFGSDVYDFKRRAWKVETKGDLGKVLKRKGMVAVPERDFNNMLDQHSSIQEREATREPTREEREKRRAELVPKIREAREKLASAGDGGRKKKIRRDASSVPDDVKSVLPDSTKAATGVK